MPIDPVLKVRDVLRDFRFKMLKGGLEVLGEVLDDIVIHLQLLLDGSEPLLNFLPLHCHGAWGSATMAERGRFRHAEGIRFMIWSMRHGTNRVLVILCVRAHNSGYAWFTSP